MLLTGMLLVFSLCATAAPSAAPTYGALISPNLSIVGRRIVSTSPLPLDAELLRVAASTTASAVSAVDLAAVISADSTALGELADLHVDLPHYWTDADVDELQWPPLAHSIRSRRRELQALAPPARVSDADFARALDLVSCHGLRCDGRLWLVPATSLFDRSAPHGARLCRDGEHLLLRKGGETRDQSPAAVSASSSTTVAGAAAPAASATASAPVSGSTSVCVSSGWQSNAELLLWEGWADDRLASDAVELPEAAIAEAAAEALQPRDSLLSEQRAVMDGLRRFGYLPDATADGLSGCHVFAGGYASDTLGRYLQALALTADELGPLGISGCTINIGEGVPLSCEHERRVGVILRHMCDTLLRRCPSTAAEDEALLHRLPLPGDGQRRCQPRLVQCVRGRLSRKRMLASCRELADAWVQRPTAMASLRRPWRVNIRTSG